MDSDSSSFFETTYSQDERIKKELEEEKEIQEREKETLIDERKKCFQNFIDKPQALFQLPGLDFFDFHYQKIKFSFRPSQVVNFVSKKPTFYCSLRYVGAHWLIRRDSFPVTIKWRIYRLFYAGDFLAINDDNLIDVIVKIYETLVKWSTEEEKYQKKRYKKYLNHEDIELNSEDEELFLTDVQREALHQRRAKICKRMLPPSRRIF